MTGGLGERAAHQLDHQDTAGIRREEFCLLPYTGRYATVAYFTGNSLGLQPRAVAPLIEEELQEWARSGARGQRDGRRPWFSYHEQLRHPITQLAGALPQEVVAMNSLTVNLHLLMLSFYRPTNDRPLIAIEDNAFPSDSLAVESQASLRGLNPAEAVVRLKPADGGSTFGCDEIVDYLEREGSRTALLLLGGVNHHSGELLDIRSITEAAHEHGVMVGVDLAHAIGNVPLSLHDWGVDFAAWCTYKYLNGSPGGTAGAFVHERHLADSAIPRLHGWWSTDPESRFTMGHPLQAPPTADAWAISCPSVLSMAPLLASFAIFEEVGIEALRAKSIRLTGYLESHLFRLALKHRLEIITPSDPARRGAQLSVRLPQQDAARVAERLREEFGVMVGSSNGDVLRLAPAPLYTSYHDCWRAAQALSQTLPHT